MAEGQIVGRISIKVSPDTSRFREELRAQLAKLEKTVSGTVRVAAELDQNGTVAKFRALMTRLQAQANDGVHIRTDVNRSVGDQLQGITQRLNDASDSAGLARRSFLGLSQTGWIVTGVFAAAAPAIGLVAGLLAGLPSLMSAFGAGAGAVGLGLDGIKSAAAALAPRLESLKASVSSVFEARLTPIFDQLGSLFPVLESGMGRVADGLADMMQGFTNVVTSAAGLAQIDSILANTSAFFSGLAPTISAATQAFLTLSSAGSNAFGYLQGSLSTFANGFNEMVNRITSSGAFDSAMKGLSQTLDSVFSLFNRLMESGVTAMGQLGGPLSTLINGIGDAFIAAMPALTSFATLIGNVAGTLGTALAPVIAALTPSITLLADTLGTLLTSNLQSLSPLLTTVAEAIGTTLTTALTTLQPILPGLVESFSQLTNSLATHLAPVLPQLATSFGQFLGATMQLAPSLLQLLTQAVIPMIPNLVKLAEVGLPVATFFTKIAASALQAVTGFIQLIGPVAQLASAFAAAHAPINTLGGVFDTIKNKVIEFGTTVVTEAGKVVAEMTALPGKITGAVGNMGSLLVGAGKALMDGLLSGIKSGLQAVLDFASGIADKIASVKGPLPYDRVVLEPAGLALMQGLENGIDKGMQSVLTKTKDLAAQIAESIQPSGVADQWGSEFGSIAKDAAKIGPEFATSVSGQLMSDLGIGGGAISAAVQQGLGFAEQFIFNVGSMDDALVGQQRIQNKKSMQYVRR